MATWTKKSFSSAGVTEHPPGDGIDQLQKLLRGKVVLALDVSGSMTMRDAGKDKNSQRLQQAVLGCRGFIRGDYSGCGG